MNFCKVIQLDERYQVLLVVGIGDTLTVTSTPIIDRNITLITRIGSQNYQMVMPYESEDEMNAAFDNFPRIIAFTFVDEMKRKHDKFVNSGNYGG